ncbi:DUF2189 domain-containing protein [Azohydromonas caseinilytica]|uniref:DUF2189 domain-containing protein n=1 Tax=Azohydromonas caseinilytica TaxID=2728836 RepID=A0A848F4G5_9BURK|nr:DUF2189 domain-containing protein [Azohydromonas caseinilytica]NML14524.1 DUF2189 domain-containing protein [Azohydromonas caseinilytica]
MRTSEPAIEQSRRFGVRPIPLLRPLGWLAAGWRDLRRAPWPGLVHGVAIALFGAVLTVLAREHFWLLAGAFSGFLLVAPLLATGLYAVSRALQRRQPATLRTALQAWKPNDGRLIVFGMLLAFAGTGWVMTSTSFILTFSPAPVRTPTDFLLHVVLSGESRLFQAWLLLGGVLAAPVFASSVVAMPMLLDRKVGVLVAVLTSWRVVMEHPLPLALWAALIMSLTLLGMATLLLGLIVVVPWLAHASWHAYRDLVDTSLWPELP